LNTTTDNRLWVNVVRFTVKDGKQDQFKQILIPYLKKAMKAETEILVCYVSHVKDQPNKWMTFQVFQNDDTFKNYVNSDGFHQVMDELTPLFEERKLEQLDGQVLINQGHY
jgi:quinol monooxygenase YgiN